MSKAILVIDMPQNCNECSVLEYCHNNDGKYDLSIKQSWCPLQPMPEYSRTGKSDYYQWGDWEDGWNACIDGLLPE